MTVREHTVTVAGIDVSCLVDAVSIVYGRDDPGSQPNASAATVDLTATNTDPLPAGVDVGAALVVTTTLSTGATVTRFTGRVTDVTLGWDDAGEDTPHAGVGQIVAVGPLADFGRRVVGDTPWPTELDGARVGRVMAAAGYPLDPITSDPGTVALLARDVDSQPALELARDAATTASGVLWETRDGVIRYADANHRRGIPVSVTLDACDVLVTPTWRRTIEGLINEVSVGYGVTPEGEEQPRFVATAPTSVAKWGRYGYTAATDLAALADATAMANVLLARNSEPVWVMAALPVDVAGLDDARSDALLGLNMHDLLSLTGLPTLGTAPTTATLWVEGWAETLTYGGHDMDVVVSGYCRTVPPPRWDDAAPTLVWGDRTLVETRRNLSVNPRAVAGGGTWWPNVGYWDVTMGVPVTGHPHGLTTACRNVVNATIPPTETSLVSLYNVDGLGAEPAVRGLGAWVLAPRPANVSMIMQGDWDGTIRATRIPANVWTYCTTAAPGPGSALVIVQTADGSPATVGETTYVTGSIAEAGKVPATYFDGNTPDTTAVDYAWTGPAHQSASVESNVIPAGTLTETRRNLSVSPVASGAGGGWNPNDAHWTPQIGYPVTDHPLGIATAVRYTVNSTGAGTFLASTYSGDGLGGSPVVRGAGAWVKPPVDASVRVYLSDDGGSALLTPAPANVWTFARSLTAASGYLIVEVQTAEGATAAEVGAVTYLTGSIAEAGTVPVDYFDGNTTDTGTTDYAWTGIATASASVMSTRTALPTVPPTMTWDEGACLGPPPANYGRWNDQPASLRWDQLDPATTWDNYGNGP
jgi:hypothetical protein